MTRSLILAALALLGCHESTRTCETAPAGGYAIDFNRALFACDEGAFPEDVVLGRDAFSSDGCELVLDGPACADGPGFCGELRWTAPGIYEGDLSYATMTATGNGGGRADCLIHSEEAQLTLVDPAGSD